MCMVSVLYVYVNYILLLWYATNSLKADVVFFGIYVVRFIARFMRIDEL